MRIKDSAIAFVEKTMSTMPRGGLTTALLRDWTLHVARQKGWLGHAG